MIFKKIYPKGDLWLKVIDSFAYTCSSGLEGFEAEHPTPLTSGLSKTSVHTAKVPQVQGGSYQLHFSIYRGHLKPFCLLVLNLEEGVKFKFTLMI